MLLTITLAIVCLERRWMAYIKREPEAGYATVVSIPPSSDMSSWSVASMWKVGGINSSTYGIRDVEGPENELSMSSMKLSRRRA